MIRTEWMGPSLIKYCGIDQWALSTRHDFQSFGSYTMECFFLGLLIILVSSWWILFRIVLSLVFFFVCAKCMLTHPLSPFDPHLLYVAVLGSKYVDLLSFPPSWSFVLWNTCWVVCIYDRKQPLPQSKGPFVVHMSHFTLCLLHTKFTQVRFVSFHKQGLRFYKIVWDKEEWHYFINLATIWCMISLDM